MVVIIDGVNFRLDCNLGGIFGIVEPRWSHELTSFQSSPLIPKWLLTIWRRRGKQVEKDIQVQSCWCFLEWRHFEHLYHRVVSTFFLGRWGQAFSQGTKFFDSFWEATSISREMVYPFGVETKSTKENKETYIFTMVCACDHLGTVEEYRKVRATSHTRLTAHDYYTSSTLIGGNGGGGPSSLHTTLEGPPEFISECKMDVKSTWIPTWHRMDHVSCTERALAEIY